MVGEPCIKKRLMSMATGLKEKGEIIFNGHAEISSHTIITTKDTKKECQYVLSFLRDLRVLRGGIT